MDDGTCLQAGRYIRDYKFSRKSNPNRDSFDVEVIVEEF